MKKIALPSLLVVSVLAVTSTAAAQNCPPGSWLCADVQINTGVQPVPPQPPPQPPVVYYQQPQPPPVYYYQQPRIVVTSTPVYTYAPAPTYTWVGYGRDQAVGIGGHVGGLGLPSNGAGTNNAGLWGFGGSLRFRSHPYLATELSIDFFNGNDYNGDLRSEVPVAVSELFYLNPQNRFQLYGLIGIGGSWASVQYDTSHGGSGSANYGYLGGQLGVGAEWQLSPHFSLYGDVRGFLRGRIDGDASTNPEFVRIGDDGHVQTSNVSVGAVFQLGALLYL